MKKIINNEIVEMTAEDLAQMEIEKTNSDADIQANIQAKQNAEATKASALAKLEALGLTQEEVKAIL